jgi:hypothetical protein
MMEDLKHLSEISTRYGNRNVNELEFKTPEDFKKYKAKHKMRPGTIVKVAGKDKVVKDDNASKKMKMHKKKISDFMKSKDEPYSDEVFDYIDIEMGEGRKSGFDSLGSAGKKLKRDLDTAIAYEMGIYDMTEKEYFKQKKQIKKQIDRIFK